MHGKHTATAQAKIAQMKVKMAELVTAKYGERVEVKKAGDDPTGNFVVDTDIMINVNARQWGYTDTICCQVSYDDSFRETKKDGIPYNALMTAFDKCVENVINQRQRDINGKKRKEALIAAIKASAVELYDFGDCLVKLSGGNVEITHEGRVKIDIKFSGDNPNKVIEAIQFLQNLKID